MATCLALDPFSLLLNIFLLSCTNIDALQYAAVSKKGCFTDLKIEWIRELGSSPFVGMPIITDVNGDGALDIVAASFSGEIHALQAGNGQQLPHSNWPFKLAHSSVLTSPLQHDVNKDGMLDIIITSAEGSVTALTKNGDPLPGHSYQIEPLYVKKDWHLLELTAHKGSIHNYILDSSRDFSRDLSQDFIAVDPHILASPIIADLNRDGQIEEMVIPISFYYDQNYYNTPEGLDSLENLDISELSNYLASALLILNITSMVPIRTLHLELTKTTAEYPGYLLFPPTVADLDGTGSELEVVVGTSAGQVHAFDLQGKEREGFPIPTDTIHGQITVEDVNMDGRLELIVVDISGNVGCYDTSGHMLWEAQISGSSSPGSLVADLNLDGKLDVLIAANDGQIWALSGDTGMGLNNWPIRVGQKLVSQPLITKLNQQIWPTVISVAEDGRLHMLRGNGKCRHASNLGETSLVPVLSHDLIPSIPGLELLVATQDGTLMCLSQKEEEEALELPELYAWPSELKGTNDFTFHDGKYGLLVHFDQEDIETDHTSTRFSVTFTIVDTRQPVIGNTTYIVNVYIGSVLLAKRSYTSPGRYTVEVPSPNKPLKGQVLIICMDNLGKVFHAIMPIKFHMTVFEDVKWLLIGPVIGMSLTLLFVYGFPDSDLLPTSMPTKNR